MEQQNLKGCGQEQMRDRAHLWPSLPNFEAILKKIKLTV